MYRRAKMLPEYSSVQYSMSDNRALLEYEISASSFENSITARDIPHDQRRHHIVSQLTVDGVDPIEKARHPGHLP